MPQFRDISTFTEKTSLDGSEEVQVSATQKAKLVKLLEQLGDSLEASVAANSSWTFPNLGTKVLVKSWLSAIAYACGLRDFQNPTSTMFRFLLGGNGDATVFGVVFYDSVNAVKVAVLFSNYGIGPESGSTFPFAIYEGGGTSSGINASINDNAFIQEITVSGKWTLRLKVGSSEVPTAEQIPAGTSGSPLDAPASYVGWNPTSMSVEQALVALAYAAGIRSVNEGTLSAPFRIITQTTSGSGLTIVSYMPADEESLKWEFGYGFIRMFYASGNLLANNPTDNVLLMNAAWESYPIRISELLGVTPFDQLTSVSSLTVKAGDNIRASASTLSVLVGGANVFSQNNEYMRDAVIVANYDATVSFTAKDSSVVVRKSADVGTVTATSGKKVYTLHWAPAALQGGKVSNWEVFVNVAVYA
jgi:hypothetical protein